MLVLIIVILIGIVGFMVYKNHNKKTVAKSVATTTTSPKTPNQVATDPYAGWATYTSQSGFSFKYPTAGWTIKGNRDPGATTVTGSSQLNGNEYELDLSENNGHYLSSADNTYTIVIGLDSDVSDAAAYYGNLTTSEGSISALSNGLHVLKLSDNGDSTSDCSNDAGLFLTENNNLYKVLTNGKYLTFQASFCWGYRASTNLSYQQQASSQENTVAKEILNSFTFN